MIYADETSPTYMGGGFDLLESLWSDVPRFLHAFRSGDGIPWGDHHPSIFCGTERFFRTGYQAHLATEWIPALDGVVAKLVRGGRVADLGVRTWRVLGGDCGSVREGDRRRLGCPPAVY